ncbi:MAG: hypothetical protein V3S81_09625 [Anaerolineales bacterium]
MSSDTLDTEPTTPAVVNPERVLSQALTKRLSRPTLVAWRASYWRKISLFCISLFLFVLAINLMKAGVHDLAPLISNTLVVTNPISGLGFGWLFAYIIMSGSPVAAVALTFFDTGIIGKLSAFTMITGSRLGASFIVLFIGFIHILRGRDRATSLGMGLLSLTVTATTYLIGLLIGAIILQTGTLDQIQPQSGVILNSINNLIFDPITHLFSNFLPNRLLFLVGLGITILSFNLFDKCLPQMALKESQVGHISRLVYQPWVMFILGAGITLISMSVSVSLGVLVPLSNRGFIRRENIIPYIMGANITTFIDTLLVAVLLNNQLAFTIVFVEMTSITIVSIFILVTIFHRYERAMLNFITWTTANNRNLVLFMMTILISPIILMLL